MNSKKFDELRDAARRKAQELDDQFKVRDKFAQGVNAATEAAKKAGAAFNEASSAAREKANRIDDQYRVSENLREGAAEFSKSAEETARDVFGQASTYYRRAESAYNAGASGARLTEAAFTGYGKAREWIKENPGKAAVVSLSLIAG